MKVQISKKLKGSLAWVFAAALALCLLADSTAQGAQGWLKGGHGARITGVATSVDGSLVATASDDDTVKVWSTNGGLLRTFNTRPYQVTSVALSPDGTKLAFGTYSGGFQTQNTTSFPGLGQVFLWQAAGGWAAGASLVWSNSVRFGKVTGLSFSADGANVASCNAAGSNYVHQVSTGTVLMTSRACTGWYGVTNGDARAGCIAFSPGGLLASGSDDNALRVWNSSWSSVFSDTTTHTSNITAVAFSANGAYLASASLDKTIRVWNTTTWANVQTLTDTNGVNSLAFNPDGTTLVSGNPDGTVNLWNWSTGARLSTVAAHASSVTALAFLTNSGAFVSGGEDDAVRIWSTGATPVLIANLTKFTGAIRSVAVSPDGTLCASADDSGSVQVRSSTDGSSLFNLPGNSNFTAAIAFSPSGSILATGGGPLDPTVKLWSMTNGSLIRTIPATSNGVCALAWSPDGTRLAVGGDYSEQVISFWNPTTGSAIGTPLAGHTNGVTALAFSPKGDYLISGGRRFDNTVKVWSIPGGSLVRTFVDASNTNNIESLAVSVDGDTVLSGGSGNYAVKTWKISTGAMTPYGSSQNPAFFAAFSPDGNNFVVADTDMIRFWNATTGVNSANNGPEMFQVNCLAYSANGNFFLYGRGDGTVALAANSLGALGQPALQFSAASASAGHINLYAIGQALNRYLIYTSPDLLNWSYLSQVSSSNTSISLSDSTTNSAKRFYRAITPP